MEYNHDIAEPGLQTTDAAPKAGIGVKRELRSLGWFLLGFAWLATASVITELALASMASVAAPARTSIWATRPAVAFGAFVAATAAIGIARRHPRLGYETLRATWAAAVIDIGLTLAATVRDGTPLGGAPAYEALGFLLAAVLMTPWARLRACNATDLNDGGAVDPL